MEDQVFALAEGDRVSAAEQELAGGANELEAALDGGWIDGVGGLAEEAEENGAVGSVADAGEGEGAVELCPDGGDAGEEWRGLELINKAPGGTHRADGVRA